MQRSPGQCPERRPSPTRRARYRPQQPQWPTRSQGCQPASQVSLQVSHVLEPYRDADQAVTNTRGLTFLWRQATVGRGARVGNGGLAVTQVGRNGDQASRIDKAPGALFAAFHFKTHHGAEATLLALSQLVLRVALETGVMNLLDTVLLLQPLGQGLGVRAMGLHPQAEGFQALEEDPRIERAQGRA